MIARLFPLHVTFPVPMTRSYRLSISEAIRYMDGGDLQHLHRAVCEEIIKAIRSVKTDIIVRTYPIVTASDDERHDLFNRYHASNRRDLEKP